MPPTPCSKYLVVRDTRERDGQGWSFVPSKNCAGMKVATLKTGDYTIEGFEGDIVVERKGSVAEFAGNVFQARFVAELERLRAFRHAFLVLEFELDDVVNFPMSSDIPRSRWKYIRVKGGVFLKRLTELKLQFPHVEFIFAGEHGKLIVASLFKRFLESA